MANAGNRAFSEQPRIQQTAGRLGAMSGSGPTGRQEESGVMGAVKDTAQQWASSAADVAEQAWDSTRQGVQQAASAVAGSAEQAWDSLTSCMRRYPFATLFTGFGLGFLMAMAFDSLSRRHSFRGSSNYFGPNVGP